MASTTPRKRAVAASRTVAEGGEASLKHSVVRTARAARIVEDDPPGQNYALRLTQALDAISAAQADAATSPSRAQLKTETKGATARRPLAVWLRSLDKLPPIRLPIGPPIPWRLGLPALLALVVVMAVVGRPTARADSQGVHLPAQETYAVQQEAPLFATQQTTAQQPQAPSAQPLGTQEPAGLGMDMFDVGIKLAAVLALAYGSLMLLKRTGLGGGGAVAKSGGTLSGMRVVSSLALAPNRTVHVLKVPGGKTLLVGATPNQVNLIADLGDLVEEETLEATSFFDVLKHKIPQ